MVDCSAVYILNLVYQVDEELHGHWYSISKLYQVSLYNAPPLPLCLPMYTITLNSSVKTVSL